MVPPAPCPRSHLSCLGEGKHPAVVSQRVLLIASLFWASTFPRWMCLVLVAVKWARSGRRNPRLPVAPCKLQPLQHPAARCCRSPLSAGCALLPAEREPGCGRSSRWEWWSKFWCQRLFVTSIPNLCLAHPALLPIGDKPRALLLPREEVAGKAIKEAQIDG